MMRLQSSGIFELRVQRSTHDSHHASFVNPIRMLQSRNIMMSSRLSSALTQPDTVTLLFCSKNRWWTLRRSPHLQGWVYEAPVSHLSEPISDVTPAASIVFACETFCWCLFITMPSTTMHIAHRAASAYSGVGSARAELC